MANDAASREGESQSAQQIWRAGVVDEVLSGDFSVFGIHSEIFYLAPPTNQKKCQGTNARSRARIDTDTCYFSNCFNALLCYKCLYHAGTSVTDVF